MGRQVKADHTLPATPQRGLQHLPPDPRSHGASQARADKGADPTLNLLALSLHNQMWEKGLPAWTHSPHAMATGHYPSRFLPKAPARTPPGPRPLALLLPWPLAPLPFPDV